MKQTIKVILISVLILGFSKPNIPPTTDHVYTFKLTGNQVMTIDNYLVNVENVLTQTSTLPSNQVTQINKTIDSIRVIYTSQFIPQYNEFSKQDSILNANKKDSKK